MPNRNSPALPDASDGLRIVRHGVSWDEYARILAARQSNNSSRFIYDRGTLEIMRRTEAQGSTIRALALIVAVAATALHHSVQDLGSTTCHQRELRRGVDPDASFSFRPAAAIRGKQQIDLPVDPPPDLVIDFVGTSASVDTLPIFAACGVPEVWRYDEAADRVAILRLSHGTYRERRESAALVPLTDDMLTRLVRASHTRHSDRWTRELDAWLRAYD